MPDLDAVLSSVRAQLALVDRRRVELDRQRADVERESAKLAAAVSVMEEHAALADRPSSSDESADSPPLADGILDAVVKGSARSRRDLIRLFRPLGVNTNTLDSAILRLKKRGLLQGPGKRLVPVGQPLAPTSAGRSQETAAGSDAGPSSADLLPLPVRDDSGQAGVLGAASVHQDPDPGPLPDPADEIPLTVRVLEAVATLGACTRAVLVKHFASHGVRPAALDTALAGLRRRGKLEWRAGGVMVVSGSDAQSLPVDTVSHGS